MCVRKFLTFIIDNKFVCSDYGEIDDLLVEFSTLSASTKLISRLLLHQSSSRFLALWDSPLLAPQSPSPGALPRTSVHGTDVRGYCPTRWRPYVVSQPAAVWSRLITLNALGQRPLGVLEIAHEDTTLPRDGGDCRSGVGVCHGSAQ